jgi:radical SAM superfamily enzyme YgiQ (UPF0313 family)
MHVLFINRFLSKEAIHREPLGIMSLSAAVKPRHRVSILEPEFDDVAWNIKNLKPDVIAYSVRTGFHKYFISLNKELKKNFSFLSVFGGPHATFFPNMIEEPGVDCVFRGEAEEAFSELLDTMEKGNDLSSIQNLWFKRDGTIYKNQVRPLVQDLDTLPFPDRTLFKAYPEIENSRVRCVIAGRGCPFSCAYCYNKKMKDIYHGQCYIRRRSVDNVVQEFLQMLDHGRFEIAIFEDDTFNADKEWLREYAEKTKDLPIKIIVEIRPELVDDEVAELLKAAHCTFACWGLESGSEKARRTILKRNISDEQIVNCARTLKKHGIKSLTQNILAIPKTTLEDDLKTLTLNIKCQPYYSMVQIMQPYPGTEIYQLALALGLFDEQGFDKLGSFTYHSRLAIDRSYERENLQRLLAITVRFPFLLLVIKFLIRLKLKPLYTLVHDIYKGYSTYFLIHYKRSYIEYFKLIARYFFPVWTKFRKKNRVSDH